MSPGEPVPLEGLVLALLFAALGSAFAAVDAALGSLNAGRLVALHEEATGRSKEALGRYLADSTRAHSRWLVGRILFTALAAALVTMGLSPMMGAPWAIVGSSALILLAIYGSFAELATTVARKRADSVATRWLVYMRPLEAAILPIAVPLTWLGRLAIELLGPETRRDARVAETEVEWAVNEGQKAGALGQEPAEMIRNVLELDDLVARDVMVPRIRMTALDLETPLEEVLELIATKGHSRYPVYREKIDNVIGLLYVKDLFRLFQGGKFAGAKLRDIVRVPVNFVSESQTASAVLREMRQRRLHMAIVVDEFGGVSGLVTLEDIIEEIVGDIQDEYDREESPIEDLGGGALLVDAAVSLHDLSDYLDSEIPADEDYDSLGGLLIHHAGDRIPPVGTRLEVDGYAFVVRDASAKRIVKVEIVPLAGMNAEPAPSLPRHRHPDIELPASLGSGIEPVGEVKHDEEVIKAVSAVS